MIQVKRPQLCETCQMFAFMTKLEKDILGCPYCNLNIVSNISKEFELDSWDPNNKTIWTNKERSCKIDRVSMDNESIPNRSNNAIRFVCISDTHLLHRKIVIPECDYLIHSGDITNCGEPEALIDFDEWLGDLMKNDIVKRGCIVVPGNHDVTMHHEFLEKHWWRFFWDRDNKPDKIELKNAVVLRDCGIELDGIRIYGSPWCRPICQWAFCSDKLTEKYSRIPEGTDILITHMPQSHGRGDCYKYGSSELSDKIKEIKPLVHVVGHIHNGYGVIRDDDHVYINAASMDNSTYKVSNPPILFDIINV